MRLTITAPPIAAQKLSTWKPSTNFPTKRNNKALITTMPSPIVSRMNGRVNNTNSGFRIALKKLNSNTTTSRVVWSSQWMPGISLVAMVTPSASTSQRIKSCSMGDLIRG